MSRVTRLNENEIKLGIAGDISKSWHNDYRDSAWVVLGSLNKKLTEGDVLCVLSQFGEIEDIHLLRNEKTGESNGTAFAKYCDWRSTVLAVDNLDSVQLLSHTLRCDHARYERPKKKKDEENKMTLEEKALAQRPGHAYRDPSKIEVETGYSLEHGHNLFSMKTDSSGNGSNHDDFSMKEKRKKSIKKLKKSKKSKHRRSDPQLVDPPQIVDHSTKQETENSLDRRRRLAALSSAPSIGWNGR